MFHHDLQGFRSPDEVKLLPVDLWIHLLPPPIHHLCVGEGSWLWGVHDSLELLEAVLHHRIYHIVIIIHLPYLNELCFFGAFQLLNAFLEDLYGFIVGQIVCNTILVVPFVGKNYLIGAHEYTAMPWKAISQVFNCQFPIEHRKPKPPPPVVRFPEGGAPIATNHRWSSNASGS